MIEVNGKDGCASAHSNEPLPAILDILSDSKIETSRLVFGIKSPKIFAKSANDYSAPGPSPILVADLQQLIISEIC